MKRRLVWVLIAAVLVAAAVVMMSAGKPGARPQIELTFLGFTNSPTGSDAVFAVHFPPRISSSSWKHIEVDRWEEGSWKHVISQGSGIQLYSGPSRPAPLANGRRVDIYARYPLNTNGSWRVRVQIDEGPLRAPFFIQLCRVLGNRLGGSQSSVPAGPFYSYWITNEMPPAAGVK